MLLREARTADGVEVLLGRRGRRARFMPGVYVFPGGRVSALDWRPSGFDEPFTPQPGGLDARSRRGLATFARAALRETFEETGLLVAAGPATAPPVIGNSARRSAVWTAFARAGLSPAFGTLRLVARAITPTRSPIRFHTRFFLAEGAAATGRLGGDGELEDLRWVPAAVAPSLPMAEVTALVLEEAVAHRAAGPAAERPAALFHWAGTARRSRRLPTPRQV